MVLTSVQCFAQINNNGEKSQSPVEECLVYGTVWHYGIAPLEGVQIRFFGQIMAITDSEGNFSFTIETCCDYILSFAKFNYWTHPRLNRAACGQQTYDMGIITMEEIIEGEVLGQQSSPLSK